MFYGKLHAGHCDFTTHYEKGSEYKFPANYDKDCTPQRPQEWKYRNIIITFVKAYLLNSKEKQDEVNCLCYSDKKFPGYNLVNGGVKCVNGYHSGSCPQSESHQKSELSRFSKDDIDHTEYDAKGDLLLQFKEIYGSKPMSGDGLGSKEGGAQFMRVGHEGGHS